LADPGWVGRLVLLSASAGIDDPETRAARRARDEQLATEIEDEDDVAAFVGRWLAQPMFASLDGDAAATEDRTRNTAPGLAASLRTMGTGTQEPLWERLDSLSNPALVVTGTTDVRFTRTGERLRDALGNSTLASIPGAGHAVHLEQPALTARLVGHWLDGIGH
jgi:2-succinyl-6-hydroxy-2,4-cyclohexadiene-1-carboxylate synthase